MSPSAPPRSSARGQPAFPSSPGLSSLCIKNLSQVDHEKAALPQLLGDSGSFFLILIGFLIGLFMGCAIARDEKARQAIMVPGIPIWQELIV